MVSTFIGLLDIQSWWEIPCISHFCSLFSSAFDLPDIDIEDLESALLCDGTDYQVGLVPELIVRLLKGCDALKCVANDITTSNYQMFLRRYLRQQCRIHNIENHFDTDIDFQSLAVRKRLLILHALCHFRLESRDVEVILSNLEADSLRVEPLGYDSKNSGYWYFYGTRLYREDTKQNNKTKIWQVICFTEEDWQNLAGKFKSATNNKERALYNILNENFLPKLPQLFREREKLRRKKLLQTRNSSRIRNLVEVRARQEEERVKAERLERARLEQRMLLEPPRLATTTKSRRRRSQSTSTASGISTYASSVRPTTNSSDFLYQRETFCLTPDDVGAESTSTIAPNQVDQTSQNEERNQEAEEEEEEAIQSASGHQPQESTVSSSKVVTKKGKAKKSKAHSQLSKKTPTRKARESGDCSSSVTEDKENCRYVSDSDSESDNNIMAPTTTIKLPGRQTNNSLSSLPGNIFIPPLVEGKEPESPNRRASNSSGKAASSGKKQRNQNTPTTPAASTSSASAIRAGTSAATNAEPIAKKKKTSSKSSSEDFTETDEVLQIGMHKVLVYVKNHRDAWPFMDPVEEDIAPRYYTIIRRPMDLLKMEDKLDNGEYNKFSEFRNDFKLIVNNCRLYNGQNNEYTEMVNNLKEAFDKATKKYFDQMSDDDDDLANLNYPDSKMNVFREKYFNKENSEGEGENLDSAEVLNKKMTTKVEKSSANKQEKDEETDDNEVEAEVIAESATRSNKRKRKDKDKRKKKKSKNKPVEEPPVKENYSSAEEEAKCKKKKDEPSTSTGSGRKMKRKSTEKVNNKQNGENKRKLKSSTASVSKKTTKAEDTEHVSGSDEEQPSDIKQPVKVQEKNSQSNQKSKKATPEVAKKRKSRAKRTTTNSGGRSKASSTRNKSQTGPSHSSEVGNGKKDEHEEAGGEDDEEEEEDGCRSRSVSPFKVDLHKKYAKSALNDESKTEEYDEADFKSVSSHSSSRESSPVPAPFLPEPAKTVGSKLPVNKKQPEYRKQSSTGSSSDQSPAKNEKLADSAADVPLFLDKYDLIKQRRSRTNIEEKLNTATVAKKEPKKINSVASASSSTSSSTGRNRASRESSEKTKAKSKEVPLVKKEIIEEVQVQEESKKVAPTEDPVKSGDEYEFKESESPKQSANKVPKKLATTPVTKKLSKESEKPPAKKSAVRKTAAASTAAATILSSTIINSLAKAKPPATTNLEALELETEQTLKDINRWLEHTPRFPEFSSASNSPSRYNALLDDFDSVSAKLDPADFRRPVPIATPKIDLVPKLTEIDDLVAEAEVPNGKKDLITELIPALGSSSVSSSCGTPPHSNNSNNSAGSTSVNASSTSSLALTAPIVPQKPKEPSTIQLISNPPPPPHIKHQMQKEAKRKSLKEKLSAAANPRRKDVMGTIDRMKPGKAKGNLIQNTGKPEEHLPLTVQQKAKEIKNALVVKTDESVPKLSLGSVLDNDGFGLGHSHNFTDREKTEGNSEKRDEMSNHDKMEKSLENETDKPCSSSMEIPFEVKKVTNPDPKADASSGTPDLSAWLKAFGVSKKAKKPDEEENKPQQPKPIACSNDATTVDTPAELATNSLNILKSPTSTDTNNFSQPPSRQRKASTGSTISERSSFSQDPDSPRIAIDERFGSYSGNYTSPIGASPIGASPIMVSPKAEEVGKPNSPYPLNGAIKVGFYQDTTTKSSPEKSCSPRELPSPYPQYSQHIYSSASSPNVSTTEMSGNSPYGGNSYAPSAGSEASKTPVYSSTSPIPNLYEQYKQPQSQESDYNSSMSPSTPNPHSPYQAGANSPYQHSAQSPYQNPNSPYQQQTATTSQTQQQPTTGQQSIPFQTTGIEPTVVTQNSATSQVDSSTPSTEVQQQTSPYQQPANSPYHQQQPSPYTPNSVGPGYPAANVFQDNTNVSNVANVANVAQQPTETIPLSAASAPQVTTSSTPQNDQTTYDGSQYHGYQQQTSCQQQQQQSQPETAIRSMYNINKSSDWNMSQVSEQFHPPTYSQYTLAAMSKDLSSSKPQDAYLQQQQQQQSLNSNPLKRHLEVDTDGMASDYNTKVPKRSDSQQIPQQQQQSQSQQQQQQLQQQQQQQQQQTSKQQQMYDSFLGSIGYGKHLDIPPNKAFEMYNRAANMGFSKEYSNVSAVKDPTTQSHQQHQHQQQTQQQQQPVVDSGIMNKPLNMANSNTYTQQQMQQQVQQQQQQHQQQNLYNKPQNSYPTNLSQAPVTAAMDKPNDSLISHLNTYKPQTYGSPTSSLLNINHHPLSSVIDDSMLGLNQNPAGLPSNGMGSVGYYDKSMPPAAHMNISSQMYQNLTPYGNHPTAISREQQQQVGNYVPSVSNASNVTVPPSAQSMEVMSLESKPAKKTRSRKKASTAPAASATGSDIATKNNVTASQPQMSSTGIVNNQVTNASAAQQQISLHHQQMQNIQGFQLYAGLKTGVSSSASSMPSSTTPSDAGAISLKTTAAAAASMVPGSAFNFGPSPAGLGLSAAGIYGENTGYLEQFRDASNPYYMPTPTHRSGTADNGGVADKSNNAAAAASYPFLAHPSSRTPTFNPFVNTNLDTNSPFYQQYLQREDFRTRMMLNQGLLAPGGPPGYPQPGGYRPSSLGMPKPYDINRQPWF